MLSLKEIKTILRSADNPELLNEIQSRAEAITIQNVGPAIYLRALIEFSNICGCNCYYCGIRKSNPFPQRYLMKSKEIIHLAVSAAKQGFTSLVLQSGERKDPAFIKLTEQIIREIKKETQTKYLPKGLGITLSVGEQTQETYQRFFEAGAHRYLLRIETSSPKLFSLIHPPEQTYTSRLRALKNLKAIGYQVGTGVMIGLPSQTLEDLAADIQFFQDIDIDMIGMGPYLPHPDTPMNCWSNETRAPQESIYHLSLAMIAAARLCCPKTNIASTTALQTIAPGGRIQGLRFGANVLMPQTTPSSIRANYLLYEGKPCSDENSEQSLHELEKQVLSIGRKLSLDKWGDSLRFQERKLAHQSILKN